MRQKVKNKKTAPAAAPAAAGALKRGGERNETAGSSGRGPAKKMKSE